MEACKITGADEETVPCMTCGEPTPKTGTERCDWCWEVESRLAGYLTRGGSLARDFVLTAIGFGLPPERRRGPPKQDRGKATEATALEDAGATMSGLTVEEAFALVADRRKRWVRLGVDLVTGIWTFMCPKCGCWFALVTRPRMPDVCPKCDAVCGAPPELDQETRALLKRRASTS